MIPSQHLTHLSLVIQLINNILKSRTWGGGLKNTYSFNKIQMTIQAQKVLVGNSKCVHLVDSKRAVTSTLDQRCPLHSVEGSPFMYMCRMQFPHGIKAGRDKCEHDTWHNLKENKYFCIGTKSSLQYRIQCYSVFYVNVVFFFE